MPQSMHARLNVIFNKNATSLRMISHLQSGLRGKIVKLFYLSARAGKSKIYVIIINFIAPSYEIQHIGRKEHSRGKRMTKRTWGSEMVRP